MKTHDASQTIESFSPPMPFLPLHRPPRLPHKTVPLYERKCDQACCQRQAQIGREGEAPSQPGDLAIATMCRRSAGGGSSGQEGRQTTKGRAPQPQAFGDAAEAALSLRNRTTYAVCPTTTPRTAPRRVGKIGEYY